MDDMKVCKTCGRIIDGLFKNCESCRKNWREEYLVKQAKKGKNTPQVINKQLREENKLLKEVLNKIKPMLKEHENESAIYFINKVLKETK